MEQNPFHIENLLSAEYVRQAQLIPAVLPFSSATLWRKVKSGDFPRPFKLSERITAWSTESVRCWLASKNIPHADIPLVQAKDAYQNSGIQTHKPSPKRTQKHIRQALEKSPLEEHCNPFLILKDGGSSRFILPGRTIKKCQFEP
jgi:prophage regulatory protein